MPPSLLVHYFTTKEELLLELIDFIINNYKSIYIPKENSEDTIHQKVIACNGQHLFQKVE